MWLEAALLGSLGAVPLRWESVAGCPEAAAIERELGALVGEGSRTDAAEVSGRLRVDRGAYVLHLEVARAGRSEARELRAHDCSVLARAGVLVAAVTLDALGTAAAVDAIAAAEPAHVPEPAVVPARAGLEGEPAPGREGSRPGEAAPSPTSQSTPGRRPPPRRGGVTLAASAGVSQGMTPGVAGGIEGELRWRRGPVRLAVAGFHWFSRATELQPEVGVEAALSGGSLRGCVAFERARLEVPLCTGLDLAAMHGGGSGSRVVRRDVVDLWLGVFGGAGLVLWPTRRLALQARVEGVLAARRAAMFLVIDDAPRDVFRMAPVGLRLWVGPLVRLW